MKHFLATGVALLAVALTLSACTTPADPGTLKETVAAEKGLPIDVRGNWVFDRGMHGAIPLYFADDGVSVEFNDGSARINETCTQFDIPMNTDLSIVATPYKPLPEMSCAMLGPSARESAETLSLVDAVSRVGNRLTLTGPDLMIEFIPQPADDGMGELTQPTRDVVVYGKWVFNWGVHDGSRVRIAPGSVTFQFIDGVARVDDGCGSFEVPMPLDANIATGPLVEDDEDGCFRLDPSADSTIALLSEVTHASRSIFGLELSGEGFSLEFSEYREQ